MASDVVSGADGLQRAAGQAAAAAGGGGRVAGGWCGGLGFRV
jgi:hypothetical protein